MSRTPDARPDARPEDTAAGARLPYVATILFLAMALAGAVVLGESLGLWHLPAARPTPASTCSSSWAPSPSPPPCSSAAG